MICILYEWNTDLKLKHKARYPQLVVVGRNAAHLARSRSKAPTVRAFAAPRVWKLRAEAPGAATAPACPRGAGAQRVPEVVGRNGASGENETPHTDLARRLRFPAKGALPIHNSASSRQRYPCHGKSATPRGSGIRITVRRSAKVGAAGETTRIEKAQRGIVGLFVSKPVWTEVDCT